MTKYFATIIGLLIMLSIWSFSSINFSDEKTQQLISKNNRFNNLFPQERIYLHIDRPSYWANDDIWFKAYVKDSPIKECNLYVEIINSSGSVVYKNIAWVQNGLAYGDIHLGDTISSGVYQIRAYTNWMRNFNDVWFFRKDLVIWNPRDKKLESKSQKLKQQDIDLQFFPEGGTLISGIESRIAFKAIDKQGKGIDFTGVILDDAGNTICEIETTYKGIGSFVFLPQEGREYKAQVIFPGNLTKDVELQKPEKVGTTLTIHSFDSTKIDVQIISNSSENLNSEYLIVGQSGGEICYQTKTSVKQEIKTIEIEKQSLPGGIIKFTLFDSNLLPICERLVFNNQVDNVNLVVISEKPNFTPREKVKIGIAAITKNGYPSLANLSMSVYNADAQLKKEEYPNNIYTHFLLNSELKGNIENPAWYFKDDSLSTQIALDNLMLTHGYREFEWKEILKDEYPEINFQPESSIQLKGRVLSNSLDQPIENAKVTMMTLKSLLDIKEEETDSLGQFLFSDLYFYDTISVSLQALDKRGNRTAAIEIDNSSSTSPESDYLPYSYEYNREMPIETLTYLSETKSDLIQKKWSLSDTILLEDVNVLARKKKKVENELVRIYAEADYVFDVEKNNDFTGTIFETIEGKIPGIIYEENTESFYARGDKLKIYLDGMEDRSGIVATLPSQMFDKVEYVKSGIFAGVNYKGGILFFYGKRGQKNIKTTLKTFGMGNTQIIGYSVSRKFYSPLYESTEQPEKKEDHRNTIYWNPVVRTDSTGVAIVEFYNSDEIGNIQVIVEGITNDGKLCRGLSTYEIKN